MSAKKLYVITDLQYGSCGKGLFAGYMALCHSPDAVIAAWGPNAGHTFMWDSGEKMVNIALPNGIISRNLRRVFIGPGSVIDPDLLIAEMERYRKYLDGVDIVIHANAAVVQERHRQAEAEYGYRIGSTMKGVGEAVIEKIRRTGPADRVSIAREILPSYGLEGHVYEPADYQEELDKVDVAIVEGAQGFSLSINHGFYPYVTSRDCTTLQILSDCGIPMTWMSKSSVNVIGVCRTFPIRVANRFNNDGNQIGWSGPCYPDQEEISWEDIGVEPELTTVTRLPRRVFTFSLEQVRQAVRQNGVNAIFLNFMNYMRSDSDRRHLIEAIEDRTGADVRWIGHGPKVGQITDRWGSHEQG